MIIGGKTFDPERRSYIMGVLNVSPESPQQDSVRTGLEAALEHAHHLAESGASLIDVGAKSSFPGSPVLSRWTEARRLVPVVAALKDAGYLVSADTWNPWVAERAIGAGADLINDISGLRKAAMVRLAARHPGVVFAAAHLNGRPRHHRKNQRYADVVGEVHEHFRQRTAELECAGVSREQMILDLGIGFGKAKEDSWRLLRAGNRFRDLAPATMVSLSRKGFPPEANLIAAEGGVGFLRMHQPGEIAEEIAKIVRSVAGDELVQHGAIAKEKSIT